MLSLSALFYKPCAAARSSHRPRCATQAAGATPTPPVAPLDIAALIGPAAWGRLPPAVQRRFAAAHADTVYAGRLDLHCSTLGRCFAWATGWLGGPLTGLRARAVDTHVHVHGDGRGGVVWERHLAAGGHGAARVVRSTKRAGPQGSLIEQTDGGLAMQLTVSEEHGALVFQSHRYFLQLGWLRLPVPALCSPGVCRVEHHDAGRGCFRFTLSMVHPLWGRTFHQTGLFHDPQGL